MPSSLSSGTRNCLVFASSSGALLDRRGTPAHKRNGHNLKRLSRFLLGIEAKFWPLALKMIGIRHSDLVGEEDALHQKVGAR